MVTLKQTLSTIRLDFKRKLSLEYGEVGWLKTFLIFISPTMTAVTFHRLAYYAYHNKLGICIHLLTILSTLYSKCAISPVAEIKPGLVIHNIGVGIPSCTVLGENCTFWGRNTITLGMIEGVDVNKDRIVIGDYCTFGFGARLMRPIQINSGANIHPNAVVLFSEPKESACLSGAPAKKLRKYG